jgi:uroporphyrin-3 C-methyltransferase
MEHAPGASPLAGMLGPALALLALLLGLFLAYQMRDLAQRLDLEQAARATHEQHDGERERRLAELERQWTLAQGEADVAAGQVTDADLRRRRDMLALIDIERVVEQAQLQLRLGAPAGAAIDALVAVDARLGRLGSARALRIQAALHHDLIRLRGAPDIDRGALAARLDPLLAAVDSWHATADAARRGAPPPAVAAPEPAPEHVASPPPRAANAAAERIAPTAPSTGARVRAWIESEFGDLLRIREVPTPEALLLGPAQQQLLRDRVRLGVLDLRQAILARDERTIRSEETALEALLQRYFDPAQPAVAAALAQLRATASAALPNTAPSLDETLGALRSARGGNDG